MSTVVVDGTTGEADTAATDEMAAQAPGASQDARDGTEDKSSSDPAAATAVQGLIVVEENVYRAAGQDSSVDPNALSEVGTTRSDLGGQTASQWRVLGTDDPAHVYIEQPGGVVLAFDRVTRSFQARTYVLQSNTIASFAERATLPASIPEPSSPDGKPVFLPVREASDPQVYVRTGTDPGYGIALPPESDPSVAGGWSWWVPAP